MTIYTEPLAVIGILEEESIDLSNDMDLQLSDLVVDGHDILIFTYPGISYEIVSLTDAEETPEEYLDTFANETWLNGDGWPETDPDYTAIVINSYTRIIESITGTYLFREF
jgi:hypothetical protein